MDYWDIFLQIAANLSCGILAPTSEHFSSNVYEAWGYGGIAFLAIPAVMTLAMIAIYAEEVYYIFLKGDSKELINSLCWLLGTHPAIMLIGTIAVFVPRAVVYLTFLYGIFVAFAIYKFYYLIMVFAGGTQSFVEKSRERVVKLNQFPCCCIVCLPKVFNSTRLTLTAKWFIQQNIILTPLYGALGVLLKSDSKLYSLQGVSASMYLSIFNAIATLMCMYGFKLLSQMTLNIEGMNEVHAIVGKTICMQLTMFVTGFEGIIFNVMAQYDVFPCVAPLNFLSRRQVIYNYAVVLQAFFLGLLARYYFRRQPDIQRQAILNDCIVLDGNSPNAVFTAVDAYMNNTYDATKQDKSQAQIRTILDDGSSTSA